MPRRPLIRLSRKLVRFRSEGMLAWRTWSVLEKPSGMALRIPATEECTRGSPSEFCRFRLCADDSLLRSRSGARVLSMDQEENMVLKQTMFVKVHMEGYCVGRKIDVMAHDSYESLFHTLRKMFHNFLCNDYNASYNPEEEEHDIVEFDDDADFVLVFEDHDGNRMLVADVPWKLFMNTVKRLYILNNPKATPAADEKAEEMDEVASSED